MSRWSMLPAYLVRLAGFSFDRLAPLRCVQAAAAGEALDAAAGVRLAAGRALDEALGRARYADNPAFDDPAARKALTRRFKQARAFARQLSSAPVPDGALADVVRVVPGAAALAADLVRTHVDWQRAASAFTAAFTDELAAARAALHRLYGDARVQEAVFLQSPEAFDGIQQLLAAEGPRNKPARRRERLAAMYAQRFCAKNDTNSICGPIGIGYLAGTASPGAAGPAAAGPAAAGPAAAIDVVIEDARRATYFSHWAAQRLLDEAVRRANGALPVTLRLHPSARVDDRGVSWCVMTHGATQAFHRRYARSELPAVGVRLLRALARPVPLAALAALGAELELAAGELDEFVDQLTCAGVVLRGPALPPGSFHPLRALADELARWPASDARAWALAEIDAVEQLVAAFARAPLGERVELYRRLGARFEAATGQTATRGEGRHYADRAVIHEDCYVEVRTELGAARSALDDVLPAVIAVLEIPHTLARERVRAWFRARFGEAVRVPVLEAHRAFDVDRVLEAPATTARAEALRGALERVRRVIERGAAAAEAGPVRLSTGELRHALAGAVLPAHAGYVSADVMLRRLPQGDCELVLSEVHGLFWIPTCALDILPPDHRERVLDHMRAGVRELARGRRTAECVMQHTQATDRRFPLATTDLQLIVASDRPDALDLGALDLRLTGDDFEFLSGDEEIVPVVVFTRYPFILYTSRIAPLYDDYAESFFPDSLLPEALRGRDAPRLSVDNLVIRRRVWYRPASRVRAALAAGGEAELFARAQALRRELGCDPQVFVSLSGEPKPLLLDFHNPFLIEALVNLLEHQPDGAPVKLSEMLPGPGELVARGPDGVRTSELRIGCYRS